MKIETMPHAALKLSGDGFTNPRAIDLDSRSGGSGAAWTLRELAGNIATLGLQTPLLVTPKGVIIAGQRRWLAIGLVLEWVAAFRRGETHPTAPGVLQPDDRVAGSAHHALRQQRVMEYVDELATAVPVRVLEAGADIEAIALADNLQREEMTSYDIAARLAHLHEQGATGSNLARMTGKSKSWVSRKLSSWAGACPALREAWRRGDLTDDVVLQLSDLTPAEQESALTGPVPPRAVRGPVNRPGIDTVKTVLEALEPRWDRSPNLERRIYARAVRDALRWFTGQTSSPEFAALIEPTTK